MTNRTLPPLSPALFVLGLGGLAGCVQPQPPLELTAWAVGGGQQIAPSDTARRETDCYSHVKKRISLFAARNETVDCQLVLTAGPRPVDSPTVVVGPLTGQAGALPRETVRLFQILPVRTGRAPSWMLLRPQAEPPPAGWPDLLLPLDAAPGRSLPSVPAGQSQPVWIDVSVPKDALPGTYTATIDVLSDSQPIEQLQLSLDVLPVALPDAPSRPVLVGVDLPALFRSHLQRDGEPYVPAGIVPDDPMAGQAKALLDATLRLFRNHRCSALLTGVYPAVSLDASGRMLVDWDTYDRTVAGALASDPPAAAFPLPVDESFPPPASYGGVASPAYAAALQTYLKQVTEHFKQKGWSPAQFLWTHVPKPYRPEPSKGLQAFASLLGATEGRPPLLTTAIPQPMKPFGWQGFEFDPTIAEFVSIWTPPGRFYDPDTMVKQRALGRSTWMMIDRPPFTPSLAIGAPSVDPRALAWQTFRYDVGAVLVPQADDWTATPAGGVLNADTNALAYPGKSFNLDGPLPSVRHKHLRRGLQDVEYLTLLKTAGDAPMADTLARVMFRYGGAAAYGDNFADGSQWTWVEQPDLWELARRVMADRLAQLKGGAVADRDDKFIQSIQWRRLVDAASKIRVTCEGVRIRESTRRNAAAGESEVELYVVVRNERPTPLTGTLRFGKLPPTWQIVADNLSIDALPCLARARLSLVARAPAIGTDDLGVAYVPVVLDMGTAGHIEIQARLTQLTVRQLNEPVVVDGNLSDWPPGLRNVAGDFIDVAGQDPLLAGRQPTGRAKQQTLVFVACDRERLYLAFNCREDEVDKLPTTSSNFIRYDGLLPADDDLLEILIDPTDAGTGQAIDVYHVVVRPTGAAFSERGVKTDCGWGSSRYWPADVRVATSRQPEQRRWTAEVSLSLAAFGQAVREQKRWALNLARYESRLGEYSSWSGARRYLYNTRSFGNMKWP
jgi:hypothetical protein